MTHPLQALAPSHRVALFLVAFVLALAVMRAFSWAEPRLESSGFKGTQYQQAGTAQKAQEILSAWGPYGRTVAAFSLGIDYLFLVCYSTLFALGCLWAANKVLAPVGLLLAWGQWLAALLDASENTALLAMIFGAPTDTLAATARWCSISKFTLIALGLAYIAVGAIAGIIEKWGRPRAHRSAASGS